MSLLSKIGIGDVLSGVGALSSLAGGVQGQQSQAFLAEQYAEEKAATEAAAAQDELQRRRQLDSILAGQRAIFASRGVELFGGSQQAITTRTKREAEEDIETSRSNYLSRARRYGLAGGQATLAGRSDLLGGVGKAATQIGPTVAKLI